MNIAYTSQSEKRFDVSIYIEIGKSYVRYY
jgi:hypothetical protein